MNLPMLVSWLAYGATGIVVLGLLLAASRLHDRLLWGLGAAFGVNVLASTMQLVYALEGVPNAWISAVWPVLHGTVLIWALGGKYQSRTATIGVILVVSWAAGLILQWPHMFSILVVGLAVATVCWRSPQHRTGLERGIWLYHVVPIPGWLVLQFAPHLFNPAFVAVRLCHLGGICLIAWWFWRYLHAQRQPWNSRPSLSVLRSS